MESGQETGIFKLLNEPGVTAFYKLEISLNLVKATTIAVHGVNDARSQYRRRPSIVRIPIVNDNDA